MTWILEFEIVFFVVIKLVLQIIKLFALWLVININIEKALKDITPKVEVPRYKNYSKRRLSLHEKPPRYSQKYNSHVRPNNVADMDQTYKQALMKFKRKYNIK